MPYDDEIPPDSGTYHLSAEINRLTESVIGAAIEVHRELGPGLTEDIYHRAMVQELASRGIPFETQKTVDVFYKGRRVGKFKIDLLVAQVLVVELKSVETLAPVHRLQLRSYLRILNQQIGLLLNFNVPVLKDGIRRITHTL